MTYTPPPEQSWSGQCPIHYTQYPCPICTSGSYPASIPFYPDTYPEVPATVPAPNIDPWMFHSPLPQPPKYGYSFVPSVCEHCFCEESKSHWNVPKPDHETCCNCGTSRRQAPFGGVEDGWEFEQGQWHHEAFSDD